MVVAAGRGAQAAAGLLPSGGVAMQAIGLAGRICKALGIQYARHVTIHMAFNDLVRIEVDYFPTSEQLVGAAEELEAKRYVLVELRDEGAT